MKESKGPACNQRMWLCSMSLFQSSIELKIQWIRLARIERNSPKKKQVLYLNQNIQTVSMEYILTYRIEGINTFIQVEMILMLIVWTAWYWEISTGWQNRRTNGTFTCNIGGNYYKVVFICRNLLEFDT